MGGTPPPPLYGQNPQSSIWSPPYMRLKISTDIKISTTEIDWEIQAPSYELHRKKMQVVWTNIWGLFCCDRHFHRHSQNNLQSESWPSLSWWSWRGHVMRSTVINVVSGPTSTSCLRNISCQPNPILPTYIWRIQKYNMSNTNTKTPCDQTKMKKKIFRHVFVGSTANLFDALER